MNMSKCLVSKYFNLNKTDFMRSVEKRSKRQTSQQTHSVGADRPTKAAQLSDVEKQL